MRRPAISASAVLSVAALIAIWFALATIRGPLAHGGVASGHDSGAHINYIFKFDRALRDHQFPVRWVEGYQPGRGQPLFNFYQVGFYYAVEIAHRVIPSLLRAYKLTLVYLWWAAALFVFLTFRRLGMLPAALGAVVFAISPYLIFDVFVRAAYPEFAAIVAGAGVLWAIDRLLATGRLIYVPVAAALIAALLVTHLPTAVILSVMFAIHMASIWASGETTPSRFVALGGACVLGVALAAFYLWPALGELSSIQIQSLTQNGFDYHNNFVSPVQWFDLGWKFGFSISDPNNYMPLQVGAIQWVAIAAAVVIIADELVRRSIGPRTRGLVPGVALVAIALFMTTSLSRPVWELLPPLAFIQYPFRFLMLLPFAGAMLTARLLAQLPAARVQALVILAVVPLQVLIYEPNMHALFYAPTTEVNPDDPEWPSYPEARREHLELGYFPAGVTKELEPAPAWWTVQGDGLVQQVSMTDARREFDIKAKGDLLLTINTPYFPGWTVRIDGAAVPIHPRPVDAYMEVRVPPGAHRVEATFENTPLRSRANTVTVVAGLTTLLLLAAGATPFGWRLRAV